MPDGEVYTSPVETGHRGRDPLRLPARSSTAARSTGIRLRFEGGRVVAAEAARGAEYLDALLDMDDGARRLGEVAFGLNYEIDRFTRNILFDEKIGGTMHVALGSAFEELGGQNRVGAALGPRLRPARRGRGLRRRRAGLAGRPLPRAAAAGGRACLIRLAAPRRRARRLLGRRRARRSRAARGADARRAAAARALPRRSLARRRHPVTRVALDGRRAAAVARAATSSSTWVNPAARDDIEHGRRADRARGAVRTRRRSRASIRRGRRFATRARRSCGTATSSGPPQRRAALGADAPTRRRRRPRTPRCRSPSTRTSSTARALLDDADPVARWRDFAERLRRSRRVPGREAGAADRRGGHRPDAGVGGRTWIAVEGARELPRRRGLHGAARDRASRARSASRIPASSAAARSTTCGCASRRARWSRRRRRAARTSSRR